ncbi:response regulator [Pelagibius sp.]|uniref:response regulator n=1 Tax=Pelagibius sp. TaxID=1931238 RepID=UPI003BAECD80
MTHSGHILIVEDEAVTRTTLAGYFDKAGYRVTEVEDGAALWSALEAGPADLILLDIELPGEDGLSLLRQLRQTSEVAVIMVTGKTDDIDRILGLELGAHDYVTKPFNTRELLARAKNLIRLTRQVRESGTKASTRTFDGWVFNKNSRRLTSPRGEDVPLTRGEFDLLSALLSNPGRVLTRDSLLDHVSHRDWDPNDRTIDVLVGRLRRKIESDPKQPRFLVTVHGLGYVFTSNSREPA